MIRQCTIIVIAAGLCLVDSKAAQADLPPSSEVMMNVTVPLVAGVNIVIDWQASPSQDPKDKTQSDDQKKKGEPGKNAKEDSEPTLDDLLGLDDDAEKTDGAGENEGADIQDQLNPDQAAGGSPISKLFLEAVKAMDESATRLEDHSDAGLVTQRYQEEALLKLTMVIKQMQRKQQNPNQKQKQQQQPSGKKPPENPSKGQKPQPGQTPGDQAAVTDSRPPRRETELEGAISESRLEWGNLPARVRDLLLQGRNESPASLYRRLTELYYKRLAEESEKNDQ